MYVLIVIVVVAFAAEMLTFTRLGKRAHDEQRREEGKPSSPDL